ncbi:MAG: hypothetical protein R6U98_15570, partial [Pirellulaceae bacterium]
GGETHPRPVYKRQRNKGQAPGICTLKSLPSRYATEVRTPADISFFPVNGYCFRFTINGRKEGPSDAFVW